MIFRGLSFVICQKFPGTLADGIMNRDKFRPIGKLLANALSQLPMGCPRIPNPKSDRFFVLISQTKIVLNQVVLGRLSCLG